MALLGTSRTVRAPRGKNAGAHFEDQKALVVERFDRKWSGDGQWIIRLPQEDMCQALGVSPLRKYQADGGPGISEIMEVLSNSDRAEHDKAQFYDADNFLDDGRNRWPR